MKQSPQATIRGGLFTSVICFSIAPLKKADEPPEDQTQIQALGDSNFHHHTSSDQQLGWDAPFEPIHRQRRGWAAEPTGCDSESNTWNVPGVKGQPTAARDDSHQLEVYGTASDIPPIAHSTGTAFLHH